MVIARRSLLAATTGGLAIPYLARAQGSSAGGWPNRPIRLIVPWPPGGSTDTVARIYQARLGEVLGQPVVIENRGGASGSIGSSEAARAAPDGYTWMLAYDNEATNQTVMRLPYKLSEAFAPVTLVATGPLALVAHQSTPWRSFAEVVQAAKTAPDSLNYATSGVGGLAHVSTVRLQNQGDFRMVHVPYRGGGPALQDAIAGHVPLFMSNVVIISQHIRSGLLRPLGVTTKEETRHVPGVKPFAQQGFTDFEAPTWWAMLGRAGTPEPILRRMYDSMMRVLGEEEVRRKIEEQGADVIASSPDECSRFLGREVQRWGEVIRANNIRADA